MPLIGTLTRNAYYYHTENKVKVLLQAQAQAHKHLDCACGQRFNCVLPARKNKRAMLTFASGLCHSGTQRRKQKRTVGNSPQVLSLMDLKLLAISNQRWIQIYRGHIIAL